jgi:hypothetical protein
MLQKAIQNKVAVTTTEAKPQSLLENPSATVAATKAKPQ